MDNNTNKKPNKVNMPKFNLNLELLMKKSVQDAIKMTEELEKAYRGEMRLGKIFDQTFSGKEEA